jgi:hypothetical protein
MAFKDFIHRVSVTTDTPAMWKYCNDTFGIGHWGSMLALVGDTATYCFEYENDALMFRLKWPAA